MNTGMASLLLSITTLGSTPQVPAPMPTVDENTTLTQLDTPPPTPRSTRQARRSVSTAPARRNVRLNRSISATSYNGQNLTPTAMLSRYFFGPQKTKRSLSEEAECGDEFATKAWIRDGFDPNAFDAYGYTPLLNAAVVGRQSALKELIVNGADVNKSGPYGYTPLHAAAQNGHRECVALLLSFGANINAQNDDLDTPMHLALRASYIEIVYMLLRSGANARLQNSCKEDCAQVAKKNGLVDLSHSIKNFTVSIGHHHHSDMLMRTMSVF
jgi:ankyrin repeat protein